VAFGTRHTFEVTVVGTVGSRSSHTVVTLALFFGTSVVF
jgi:hypothetical protein